MEHAPLVGGTLGASQIPMPLGEVLRERCHTYTLQWAERTEGTPLYWHLFLQIIHTTHIKTCYLLVPYLYIFLEKPLQSG